MSLTLIIFLFYNEANKVYFLIRNRNISAQVMIVQIVYITHWKYVLVDLVAAAIANVSASINQTQSLHTLWNIMYQDVAIPSDDTWFLGILCSNACMPTVVRGRQETLLLK